MEKGSSKISTVLGISVIAGLVTGFVGLFGALFAFISTEFTGAGLCLLAASFSFGLLARALLDD